MSSDILSLARKLLETLLSHINEQIKMQIFVIAWQVLTKFNLADAYKGQEDPTGEDYNVEQAEDGPRPFTCLLDTGLKRTSTGSKVFAALKVILFLARFCQTPLDASSLF